MEMKLAKIIALSSLTCITTAFATNGAFDYGFSEITRGMGGAGSALPQDTLIAAINPAGMVDVGKRLDFGAFFYVPTVSYVATDVTPAQVGGIAVAPGYHASTDKLFFLPDFGYNHPINNKSAWGISMYSLAGFGGQFITNDNAYVAGGTPAPGALGNNKLETDLKQSITSVTYSHKFLSHSAWGVSLLFGLQALHVDGVSNLSNFTVDPNNLSNKGTDYSVGGGARFGVLFGVLPKLDLGISYQPKMPMTKFHQYAGLLPNGGEFDIPAFGNIGLAWHIISNVVLVADMEKIWYKDVPAYGTSHDALLNGPCTTASTCMGGANGAGFGWNNAVIYKLGAQWKITKKTTLRAGLSHTNELLSNTYATENMITPGAIIKNLYSLGATQDFSKKDAITAVVTYIPRQSLRSQNLFARPAIQYVTLNATGIGFGISWSRVLSA
ncbi:MAG: hypothetical protein COY58_03430 [Gammaproteobacteria bacterium CG_4_10_14_0_8_um_filter_38_16]|nr:MAG: hypothetical protein COY58_03430 [Gammaproteobacteria bacterium CG_4_10_14_0_8_um_filter_38_16]PJA03634.1 MAG: hypothetical protein COX72_03815 [Gammaproteobacteria bacterium CG_4_10_14_0_2_um_filter_38_22]PJB10470.1 MAG: hypothetical protein CO120_04690 [Gammaproteobacteria bacterium CG_4_9_14_3_um_filter_38_9]